MPSRSQKRAFICAGEKSGDLHAANLVRAMKRIRPELRFEGFGGDQLEAAGCRLHENIIHLSSMGLSFLSNVTAFFRLIRRFHRLLRENPPDVLVLVDFPGFNFILARLARWCDVPVVYYICPQIWAWAPWRREKILRLTDLLMVILPFEEDFYRSPGKRVVYVGHPLADELDEVPPANELEASLRSEFAVAESERIVGLFPGSRDHEIRELLPLLRSTVDKLELRPGTDRLVVSCCRREFHDEIRSSFADSPVRVDILDGDAYPLMAACHVALVASGTATLELAYFGKPMVVFYKAGRAMYFIYKLICTSPFVSLVNILGRGDVVPEDVTWRDNSELQAGRARALMEETTERKRCLESLARLRQEIFRPGASARAAESLNEFLGGERAVEDPVDPLMATMECRGREDQSGR